MAKSYQEFDRPYRRGVVLGLSLAELFLILLFLLLLATIGFLTFFEEENQKLLNEVNKNESILAAIQENLGPNPTPEDFSILIEALAENKRLREELSNLYILERLEPINEAIAGKDVSEAEIENLVEEVSSLIDTLPADEASDVLKKLHDYAMLEEPPYELAEKIEELEEALKIVESSVPPGVMPSCWQKKRDVIIGNKKYIEQYIYDVLMLDDGVIVVKRERPTEAYILGNVNREPFIESEAFGKRLSFNEYSQIFQPLTDAGENKQIRDYSCRYYVYMYDGTTSKNKYKISLNKLEKNFLRYEAPANEGWPH